MWPRLRSLWRNVVHRRRADRDLDDELSALQTLLVEEKIRAGLTPADARRAASIELGQPHIVKERVRDARAGAVLDTLLQDVRYGGRLLHRSPLFTATAVLSLGLGIGANTTIFSLVNALMLRELRVAKPRELVEFGRITQYGRGGSFSYPIYRALRDENAVFDAVLAMAKGTFPAAVEAERPPAGRLVSGNFFDVLGVAPQVGRLLSPADDRAESPDASLVAVITDGLWRRQFGASPNAIGEMLRVEKVRFSIIGVLPARFDDPLVGRGADFFMPIASERWLRRQSWLDQPDFNWLAIVGRLKPGVTIGTAAANIEPIFGRFMDHYASQQPDPDAQQQLRSHRVFLQPASTGLSDLRRDFSTPALLLMGAVSLVLLIACANVVNLLLARGVARRREIALRLAIGAGRMRLVRQFLTESTLLGVAGGALGFVLAIVLAPVLLALISRGATAVALDVAPDARLVGFAFAVSIVASLVAGAFPALRSARGDITAALEGGARAVVSRSSRVWGRSLIAAQIGLSLVLLIGASLLFATLRNIRSFDPGFDRAHVLLIGLDPGRAGHDAARAAQYYREVLSRVRHLPGVAAASLSMITPISGGGIDNGFAVQGRPQGGRPMVYVNIVSDGFFQTMGTPLLMGRDFVTADAQEGTAGLIVNDALVRRFFNGENPLGRRVIVGRLRPAQIVGVVANAKYMSLREADQPTAYVYGLGTPEPVGFTLSVRTVGNPLTFAPVIRKDLQSISASVPVGVATTLASQVDQSLVNERLVAQLLGAFAALALVLAAVGLYGVLGYAVARRTPEIGVRLALGASRGAVLRDVLNESWVLTALGAAIGVPAAIVLSRFLETLLYSITPWDPRLIALTLTGLFVVATGSAALPAWRASRIDPLTALRHE
jgi:predicted permease